MYTKKFILGMCALLIVGFAGFLLYKPASKSNPEQKLVTVEERANAVLVALKNKDGGALSALVHRTKGVRFSPYGYISTSSDMVIMAGSLADIYTIGKKEHWGSYDGSGEPIHLTFTEYSTKFLYDVDFLSAPQKAINTVLGHGNSLINITEAYPGATFVEYYFPGFDPQYEGMDWRSLRLIFQQEGGVWYLVGISHDQWTI